MGNSNREKIKELNTQQLQARLSVLNSSKNANRNPIEDIIEDTTEEKSLSTPSIETKTEPKIEEVAVENNNLSSLQNRFGVRKIKKPIKDAQLTARIESTTLKRFKEIVKAMYYPDKPNINETVTQIIRAFVEEYDKNNKIKKE